MAVPLQPAPQRPLQEYLCRAETINHGVQEKAVAKLEVQGIYPALLSRCYPTL